MKICHGHFWSLYGNDTLQTNAFGKDETKLHKWNVKSVLGCKNASEALLNCIKPKFIKRSNMLRTLKKRPINPTSAKEHLKKICCSMSTHIELNHKYFGNIKLASLVRGIIMLHFNSYQKILNSEKKITQSVLQYLKNNKHDH